MCVVSMIVDAKSDEWQRRVYPNYPNAIPMPGPAGSGFEALIRPLVTKEEIDEFRRLLDRAREYDKKNNEPDCELEEKKKRLKALADVLGIDISFVDEKGGK